MTFIFGFATRKTETCFDIRHPLEYLAGSRLHTEDEMLAIGNSQPHDVDLTVYSPGRVAVSVSR